MDLVLTGHNHFYQHNVVNDIHHMVLGSIGAPLYYPDVAPYTVLSERTYCFGIIETTLADLTLTTYRDDGSVIEVLQLVQLIGDVNGDGAVNGLDVDPFVQVVLDGGADAATEFRSDINGDGAVNGLDVGPLVDAILAGTHRCSVRPTGMAPLKVNGQDAGLREAAVLDGRAHAVAEPMSAILLATGLVGLLAFRRA